MTPAEAAHLWNKPQETIKSRLKPSLYQKQIEDMIDRGLIKYFQKPGGTRKEWIISTQAMEEWFGPKKD
nr:DNA-binding protein [Shouchella clausii]